MRKETKINGCETGTYSRTASKCRKCMNKDYCENKRIEQVAYIKPSQQVNIDISAINSGITNEIAEAIAKTMGSRCYFGERKE